MTPLQMSGMAPKVSKAGLEKKCWCININLTDTQCHCGTSQAGRVGVSRRSWCAFVRAKAKMTGIFKGNRFEGLDIFLLTNMPFPSSYLTLASCVSYHEKRSAKEFGGCQRKETKPHHLQGCCWLPGYCLPPRHSGK